MKASGDARLLPEVMSGCKDDIKTLCGDETPGQGKVTNDVTGLKLDQSVAIQV